MGSITPTRRRLRALLAIAVVLSVLSVGVLAGSGAAGQTGSLAGTVTAPAQNTQGPVAGVIVTATGTTGTAYTTTTAANGHYELDQLPAPDDYSVTFAYAAGGPALAQHTVALAPGAPTNAGAGLTQPAATVTGQVAGPNRHPLAGMSVGLQGAGATCAAGAVCGPTVTTDPTGNYTLNVAPGSYELAVSDAGRVLDEQSVTAGAAFPSQVEVALGPAPVPAGTNSHHAVRDLRWLNGERARAGLPAGIVLNGRWSQECAAHDTYEHENNVLSHSENPAAPGASVGGAWAGLTSVLSQARWTPAASPWQNAPIHLMQLFSPSLNVIGLDDSDGLQCATTYPGLLRPATATDTVSTYPGNGARGVPPRERAREAPFVPGQFVGLPAGRTAGRELFVYLNQAGDVGQAQVDLLHATLSRGGRAVGVRWVDNSTPTIGRYLTGAIVIPVAPLRADTQYRATVVLQDRSTTITHRWSFTTGRN